MVDAAGEHSYVGLRVYRARHRRDDLGLLLTQTFDGRANLAVEVGELEPIEIRKREARHAEARERENVKAPHTAGASDGDPLEAELLLLHVRDPAQIALECVFVAERSRVGASRRSIASHELFPLRDP